MRLVAWAALVVAAVGCGAPRPASPSAPSAPPRPRISRCDYTISVDQAFQLEGRLRCQGAPIARLVLHERDAADFVRVDGERAREGRHVQVAEGHEVTYRIDLDAVAKATGDYDVAYRNEGTLVTAMSTWLPRPEPVTPEVPIEVNFELADGLTVTAPQRLDDGRLTLSAGELHWATYAVFGPLDATRLELPAPPWRERARAAELTVARMPGRLEVSPAVLDRWVEDVARQTAAFWGGFPVDHGLVIVIPTVGDDVEYGKVVAAGGAGMVILLGHDTTEADLYRDWILVHEMFHLGFPSFLREGRWLDEGLATYFEPIIRARAGWYGAEEVWDELSRNLPAGLAAAEGAGLEAATDFAGVYWGGAMVAFLADCEVRARSNGVRGLEHGLRAVLAAGGRATQVWSVERTLGVIDAALGRPVLRPLAEAHAFRGAPASLRETFARLGVQRRHGSVWLLDDAPLADLRSSIIGVPTGAVALR